MGDGLPPSARGRLALFVQPALGSSRLTLRKLGSFRTTGPPPNEAGSSALPASCHCEERSDEAISTPRIGFVFRHAVRPPNPLNSIIFQHLCPGIAPTQIGFVSQNWLGGTAQVPSPAVARIGFVWRRSPVRSDAARRFCRNGDALCPAEPRKLGSFGTAGPRLLPGGLEIRFVSRALPQLTTGYRLPTTAP